MKRHTHHLEEVGRHFAPSLKVISGLKGASEELAQKMFFGVTTIELRCRDCGDIKTTEIAGDAR